MNPVDAVVTESTELLTRMHKLLDNYGGDECVAVMMWLLGAMGSGPVEKGEMTREEMMQHFMNGIGSALDMHIGTEGHDETRH